MSKPLHAQKFDLAFKAVLIQCLDADRKPLPTVASGFIRQEGSTLFLYTCWHVVTGYNPHDVRISNELPRRKYLQVALQDAQQCQAGVVAIGGLQTLTIPLYDMTVPPHTPLWRQDQQDTPQPDLNAINIRVPFWHDAVKLPLPTDIRVFDVQIVRDDELFVSPTTLPCPGDRVFVVGYPYGFSAIGRSQPTPVVLTRYIASTRIEGRQRELLLESIGAPGMSGGPVFIQRGKNLKLMGLYTGLIYPDHATERYEKTTALGTCVDMMLCWEHLPLCDASPHKP